MLERRDRSSYQPIVAAVRSGLAGESFDHVLRSEESFEDKREYIRQNPVKAGLVERPEEYRWIWLEPGLG